MCVYICINIYLCEHVYIYMYTHVFTLCIYILLHVHKHIHTHTNIYICIFVYRHHYIYTCVHVCIHIYIYIYIYICTYIYLHIYVSIHTHTHIRLTWWHPAPSAHHQAQQDLIPALLPARSLPDMYKYECMFIRIWGPINTLMCTDICGCMFFYINLRTNEYLDVCAIWCDSCCPSHVNRCVSIHEYTNLWI